MRQSTMRRFLVDTSPRKRARVEIDMESLCVLRDYLDAESIEHDGAMPLKHLQMLVARRQRRRAKERGERPQWPIDAVDIAKTLRTVRRAMASLAEDSSGTTDQLFQKASFMIDTMPDRELVKCKHHADWQKCRGNVENGQCRQCRVITPGVLNYSFQVLIRDRERGRSTTRSLST